MSRKHNRRSGLKVGTLGTWAWPWQSKDQLRLAPVEMITIESEILIDVPRPTCFDLARTVEVHLQAEKQTDERAVGGKTSGILELGDTITFEAKHLGVRQRLTSKIVAMDRPDSFVDEMQRGAFAFLRHKHLFTDAPNGGTLMRDRLEFAAPLGLVGQLAERLFLRRYMERFLARHQREFRIIAEKDGCDV